MTECTLRFVSYNIPTIEDVLSLLFYYCAYELHCVGLEFGYTCPANCPVRVAKAMLFALKGVIRNEQ